MKDTEYPPKYAEPVSGNNEPETQLSLSTILRWLNERAWPLTWFIFSISGISLLSFAHQERVPVPLPTVIKVLPALMGLEIFIIASLIGIILLPTTLLLAPIKKNNHERLIDLWPKHQDSAQKKTRSAEFSVTRYLFIMLVYFLAMSVFIIYLDKFRFSFSSVWTKGLIFLVAPVAAYYFFIKIKLKQHHITMKETSEGFWIAAAGSILVQFVLMTGIVLLSSRGASGSENEWGLFGLYVLLAMFLLWVIQYFSGSVLIAIARSRPSISRLVSSTIVLITLPLIVPQTGAWIAATAFQMIGAGGRSCIILTWAEKNIAPGYQDIFTSTRQSKPLRIIFEDDGIYRIRKHPADSRKIYFIPLSAIASIDDCHR